MTSPDSPSVTLMQHTPKRRLNPVGPHIAPNAPETLSPQILNPQPPNPKPFHVLSTNRPGQENQLLPEMRVPSRRLARI